MSKVCVFLADGFEEIEGLTVVDILRRAGVTVTTASIMGRDWIDGAHGIRVLADTVIEEVDLDSQDMLVLPGGMPGTIHLGEHRGVCDSVRKFAKEDKWVCAICAAPTVLGKLGLLDNREATCYPSMQEELICGQYSTKSVAIDGKIITSRGMGTAIDFSLKMVEVLTDSKKAEELAKGIVYEK